MILGGPHKALVNLWTMVDPDDPSVFLGFPFPVGFGGVALGLGAVPLLTAEPAHAGVIGARRTQSSS